MDRNEVNVFQSKNKDGRSLLIWSEIVKMEISKVTMNEKGDEERR